MRIVSLVPHATELLFALGLGDQVVAVTHECDYPEAALALPHITRDRLPSGLTAAEIDAAVRERTERGEAIYELDGDRLHDLEPDLIVTQALCPVCAVSVDDVRAVADSIPSQPRVVALDPHTFGEAFGDVRTIAQLTRSREAALALIARQRLRVDAVRVAVRQAERVPTAAIEWFDPVFVAGHWTPQIIDMAGGIDVLGFAGEHSEQSTWETLAAAAPRVIVAMPCGYDAERSHAEATAHADALRTVGAERVVAVDASAYFSRPGPRLVDGTELLAHLLHPDRVDAPTGVPFEEVEQRAWA
jgi:iron complex transport system substrate-binding protein